MNEHIAEIWDNFSEELKGFILKKVRDQSIADDILQNVFLKIITHWDKISDAKNMQQYIYGITRNAIVDHFRKTELTTSLDEKSNFFSDEESDLLNATIADCCIRPFVSQLPQKYRQALMKSEFENISQKDLAKQLKISYSGAKSRVQRGKEKLKDLILACCSFPSDKYGNLQSVETGNCNCD